MLLWVNFSSNGMSGALLNHTTSLFQGGMLGIELYGKNCSVCVLEIVRLRFHPVRDCILINDAYLLALRRLRRRTRLIFLFTLFLFTYR